MASKWRRALRLSRWPTEGLDIPTLAERLDVANVLEGSVRTAGNQVRVTAQLIDVADDKHLWSETFNGTLDDIFKIQDEITAQILAQLEVRLVGAAPASATEALTSNPEAYRKYLQGRQLWRQRNARSLYQAVELFREAVALDPGFHRAWSNLALAYINLPDYDSEADIEASRQAANEAAERALQIAPGSSEALGAKADLTMMQCRLAEGARLFEEAILANAQDPTPRHWYAIYLAQHGQLREALAMIREASRIDPLISAVIHTEAEIEMALGNHQQAERLFEEAARLGLRGGDVYYAQLARLLQGEALEAPGLVTGRGETFADLARVFLAYRQGEASREQLEQSVVTLTGADNFDQAGLLALAGSPYAIELFAASGDCRNIPVLFWNDNFRQQRGTAEFFHLMDELGVVEFWREIGWPDDCASLDQGLAECPAQ